MGKLLIDRDPLNATSEAADLVFDLQGTDGEVGQRAALEKAIDLLVAASETDMKWLRAMESVVTDIDPLTFQRVVVRFAEKDGESAGDFATRLAGDLRTMVDGGETPAESVRQVRELMGAVAQHSLASANSTRGCL